MRRSTALSRCSSSSNDLTICSLFISCLSFEASLSRARFRRASSSTEAAGDVALRALVARGGEDLLRLAPLHELSQVEEGSALRYARGLLRSAEHTSELRSLIRSSYAVFCLK